MRNGLEKVFITNSFFGLDTANQVKSLTEAMIISGFSWRIVQIHQDIFETQKMPMSGGSYRHYGIMSLRRKWKLW